jgi:hypothetical protein
MGSAWLTTLRRWLGLADPNAEFEAREAEEDSARFHAEMRAGGYWEWLHVRPTADVIECRRLEWRGTEIIRPAECSPFMNVAGLYWRDVGGVVDVEASAISCGNRRLP